MKKYLELVDGAFTEEHIEKSKPENRPYVAYSTQGGMLFTKIISEQEHEYVDLGLPSGTLWATCNIGANSPEEAGDYFAWGETESYDPNRPYKWSDDNGEYTKYVYYSEDNSLVDNKTILEPEDDAATVNWGDDWRTPSIEEVKELVDFAKGFSIEDINEQKCAKITGPNGNHIIFPLSGGYAGSVFLFNNAIGTYFINSIVKEYDSPAYVIRIYNNKLPEFDSMPRRSNGASVRPVKSK